MTQEVVEEISRMDSERKDYKALLDKLETGLFNSVTFYPPRVEVSLSSGNKIDRNLYRHCIYALKKSLEEHIEELDKEIEKFQKEAEEYGIYRF